jgi:hypothetical protein
MRKRNFEYCNLEVIISALAYIIMYTYYLVQFPSQLLQDMRRQEASTPNVDNYRKVEYMDEKHIGWSGALKYRL